MVALELSNAVRHVNRLVCLLTWLIIPPPDEPDPYSSLIRCVQRPNAGVSGIAAWQCFCLFESCLHRLWVSGAVADRNNLTYGAVDDFWWRRHKCAHVKIKPRAFSGHSSSKNRLQRLDCFLMLRGLPKCCTCLERGPCCKRGAIISYEKTYMILRLAGREKSTYWLVSLTCLGPLSKDPTGIESTLQSLSLTGGTFYTPLSSLAHLQSRQE